jgi:transcriptional regulator with XRE-family HTH domain/tetratricopeptide (TPR) repeat protein
MVAMGGEGSFAAGLRMARHSAGLTLEELAEASGVSARALSDMERGRALGPQRRTVGLIADALKLDGVRRDEFLALAKAGRTRSVFLAAAPGLSELPGSIGDFTGRVAELAWIAGLVDALEGSVDRSGAAVISGGAGLGKTTLVVRAAHRLRDRFPDGVHFVEALGMSERPVGSEEILARVLRALGVRDQQIPPDGAERAGRYRQLLRERRALVIVDDAASESQVRPLVPGAGRSQLLVTSRRMLAGLAGVQRLHLTPMPSLDAHDLLGRILADRPVLAEPSDAARPVLAEPSDAARPGLAERSDGARADDYQGLVDLLGGLPLALRIVGNRLASRPQWSVADLVARLSSGERRLDQLSAGDLTVAAAFAMSYEQLPDAVRQLFRRVALLPGADFDASLAAVVGQTSEPAAEDQLDDLLDLGLLEAAPGGRYRFHDLVRLYANQRLQHEETADAVITVRRQMVAWLLSTLTAAARMFGPAGSGSADPGFASAEDAKAWIRIEAEHWFPALGAAAIGGDHDEVAHAIISMHWFCEQWVHWPHWTELFTLGLDSAARLGHAGLQAELLNYIAWTHTVPWRKDMPAALDCAQRALMLARQAGDVKQEAWALQYTGAAHRGMGELDAAMTAMGQAGELFEEIGDVYATSQALLGRGTVAFDLGDATAALAAYARALELVQDPASGMPASFAEDSLPHALGLTARALGRVGRREEAIPMMVRAAELFGRKEIFMGQAAWLRILGDELYDEDHAAEARASLLQAAGLYESTGQRDRAAECRESAGRLG